MRRFWWIVLLTFDALILCMFAFGYAARWIDPRTFWWPQLFAIALPFFSFSILLLTPILGFSKRWILLGIHGIFLFLIVVRFLTFENAATDLPAEKETIRIASYNLGHFEIFSQTEQAEKLGEILNQLHPDILGLQEFMVRYRGRELRIRNLPSVADKLDSLGYQTVASRVHDVPSTFKPVWTKREKLDMEEKHRIRVADEGHEEMSVTRLKFNWQGREAVYLNVHLRTYGLKKPWEDDSMSPLSPRFWLFYLRQYRDAFQCRAWQAEKLRQLVREEALPVILGGDFNSTPHNWSYAHLVQELRDVHTLAGLNLRTSYNVDFPLAKIDHLMVSSDWSVYDASIPALDFSDHRPLVAVLGWAK